MAARIVVDRDVIKNGKTIIRAAHITITHGLRIDAVAKLGSSIINDNAFSVVCLYVRLLSCSNARHRALVFVVRAKQVAVDF